MAGPAKWKGQVQLNGLIQFPIIAKAAVKEEKVSFNQHCAVHGARVRMGQSICEEGGEPLSRDDIVRGYMGVPGIDEDYLKDLALEKSPILTIDGAIPAASIEARYFQKSYDVIPDKGAEKVAFLFLQLLEEEDLVLIGKFVASQKETLVVLRPRDGALAMESLYWPAEVIDSAEARSLYEGQTVTPDEMAMGRQLLRLMRKEFKPEAYENTYLASVQAYLRDFTEGKTPAALPKPTIVPTAGADLASMLAAAVAAASPAEAEDKPAKKAKKGKAA